MSAHVRILLLTVAYSSKPVTTSGLIPDATQAEATDTGGHLYLCSERGYKHTRRQRTESIPPMQPDQTLICTTLCRAIKLPNTLTWHYACTAAAGQAEAQQH
jgi:hypothetical protein